MDLLLIILWIILWIYYGFIIDYFVHFGSKHFKGHVRSLTRLAPHFCACHWASERLKPLMFFSFVFSLMVRQILSQGSKCCCTNCDSLQALIAKCKLMNTVFGEGEIIHSLVSLVHSHGMSNILQLTQVYYVTRLFRNNIIWSSMRMA